MNLADYRVPVEPILRYLLPYVEERTRGMGPLICKKSGTYTGKIMAFDADDEYTSDSRTYDVYEAIGADIDVTGDWLRRLCKGKYKTLSWTYADRIISTLPEGPGLWLTDELRPHYFEQDTLQRKRLYSAQAQARHKERMAVAA